METPNFYAVIPATVRYCEALTPAAKLLYGEITALASAKGYCYASNSYFSNLYHVEERQVRRWLSQLAELGFVTVKIDKAAGNQRNIYVKDAVPLRTKKTGGEVKKDRTYGQKRPEATDKKDRTPISIYSSNTVSNVRTSDDAKTLEFEEIKKEKTPPLPARPPRLLFSETEYAVLPKTFFAEIKVRFPHVPADADFNYYHQRCADWSASKPATSNDWPRIAAKFILDDQRRGELHTLQPSTSHDNNTNRLAASPKPLLDQQRIIERASRLADRLNRNQSRC